MNGRKARMLRQAAEVRHDTVTTYEKPQLHHVVEFPVFETYTRTIRAWDPKVGKIVGREVEKIRYKPDGKTPMKPLISWSIDKNGELLIKQQTMLVPFAAPRRLAKGSPRRIYQELKSMDRRFGLEKVFQQIVAESAELRRAA